jgi:hypothetical protein
MGNTTLSPLHYKELVFVCVNRPPEAICKLIKDEFNQPLELDNPNNESLFCIEEGDFTYADAYVDCGASDDEPLVAILWEPKNAFGKTVLMTNSFNGAGFAIQSFPNETDFEWIHVLIADHPSLKYKGLHLWYVNGDYCRSIDCTAEEQDWEFAVMGKPLEFEDTRAYKNRDKSKRLTREMVIEYLRHLGYEIDVPEFWTPKQSYRIWQVNRKK